MTSPSKRRRQARQWMQVERARSDQKADERARHARLSEREAWESKLVRIIPPHDEDTFYPQGRIEQPYLRVCAPRNREFRSLTERFDPNDYYARRQMFGTLDVIGIEARQMAMILPNGAKVLWWTWEMGR